MLPLRIVFSFGLLSAQCLGQHVKFVPPEVSSIVSSIRAQYSEYIHYDGVDYAQVRNEKRNALPGTGTATPTGTTTYKSISSTKSSSSAKSTTSSKSTASTTTLTSSTKSTITSSSSSSSSTPPLSTSSCSASYWFEQVQHQGKAPFNSNSTYVVWRNVKDFGAKGTSPCSPPFPHI